MQVMIGRVIPKYIGVSGANYAKNLLHATILVQYAPRVFRFVQLLGGQSANGFILAGHVVGSLWYLFGLQASLSNIYHIIHVCFKCILIFEDNNRLPNYISIIFMSPGDLATQLA